MNSSLKFIQFTILHAMLLALLPALISVAQGSDPTFTDANWSSMNPSIPGVDSAVRAAVIDGSGNLYIGGSFTVAGAVIAHGVAKWNGSSWAALGSGANAEVSALAV